MTADSLAFAEGGHGDLVDGCTQGVVFGMADRDHTIGLVEHQHLFRATVRDQKRGVGGDEHLLAVATVKALMQAADEVGAPVWVKMGLRLVEQEQALGVLEQQAEAQGVQQLVLAIGEVLEHHRLGHVGLAELDEFEAHDALVRGQGGDRLADVMAIGLVQIGLQLVTDRKEVQREQYLKGLEQGDGRVVDLEIEVLAEGPTGGVVYPVIEIEGVAGLVEIPAGGAAHQAGDDFVVVSEFLCVSRFS